jgi:hypothetical protein
MNKGLALLSVAVFFTVALAGCSSGESGGFSVKAPGEPGGEYVFKASGSADNYTWDLGDRLTVLYGKTVRHAYDFDNGQVTVTLTTKSGDKTAEHSKPITLGTGQNAQPTFILEGQTNWTVTGETIKFSAAKSTDPDGDALRYTWSCVRTGPANRQPTHVHPGFQGVPFATAPAGSVTAVNAVGEMPAADRTVPGDLCETLGSGGKPSLDATIEGTFANTGIYDVYLLASDAAHPTTSGKYHFVVTTPEERPAELFTQTFTNTLQGGTGSLQGFCDSANCGQALDMAVHSFTLPLGGTGGNVTATMTNPVPSPAGTLTWILRRGTLEVARGAGDGVAVALPPADMKQGTYALEVTIQGVNVAYSVTADVPLDLDPFKVY